MNVLLRNIEQMGVLSPFVSHKHSAAILGSALLGSAVTGMASIATTSLSNSASSSMNAEQRKWQENEWTRQFEMTNERQDILNAEERAYNTPLQQSQRLREAGFNPSALVESSAASLSSASPDVTAHQPATPQTSMVTPNESGMASMIEAIGGLVKNIASAGKDGADVTQMQALLDSKIKQAVKDLELSEIVIAGHKLEYFVNNQLKDIKVRTALENYMSIAADVYNKKLTGKKIESETELNNALTKLNISMNELKGFEKIQASLLTNSFADMLQKRLDIMDSEIAKNKAVASESYASAVEHRAGADYKVALTSTENALRDGKVTLQQLSIDMAQITKSVDASNARTFLATEGDRLRATIAQFEREGFITSEAKARADRAIKENNWYEVSKIMDLTTQAIGSYTGYFNAGTQRLNALSEQERNRIRSEFNRLYSSEERFTENGSSLYIQRGVAP